MPEQPRRPYEPSRVVVNAGVLIGGAVGILITFTQSLDSVAAFLITGLCSLIAVAIFSYVEVFVIRPRQQR
jgi:high-affinity Fe2+/Pb2+ permease